MIVDCCLNGMFGTKFKTRQITASNKQVMNVSKRCSVSSKHQESVSSADLQPTLDFERISRYLDFLKINLRNHLKDKLYLFDQIELKEMHKIIKIIHQYFITNKENNEHSLCSLKDSMQKYIDQKESQLNQILAQTTQKIRLQESEFNRKILSMKNEFGRKEQVYKQIIQNSMKSLSNAQIIFQNNQSKFNSQIQKLQRSLCKLLVNTKHNKSVEAAIRQLVEEIQLRQEHSIIGIKEDEISIDQIDISNQKFAKKIISQDSLLHEEDFRANTLQMEMQGWITKLICFGFFQKQNEDCIKKIMLLASGNDQPAKFLESNMYPILLQILINNMKRNQEIALRYIQGSIAIEQRQQNINSISDLSINDSQIQEINFKKKDKF